jgi:hypothetical protein
MLAGMILSGKPIEGRGVVFTTLIVLVVNFSAAPSDTDETRAKATIADNLSFMKFISKRIKDDATLRKH